MPFFDLWVFLTKSISLVFNFSEAEHLFFRILLFQGPSGRLKIKGKKYLIRFSSRGRPWAKEVREESHKGQMRPGGAPPSAGRATQAHLGLEHRLDLSS
jgi:hypothetical protein